MAQRNADILGGYVADVARYAVWSPEEERVECVRMIAAYLVSDPVAIKRVHDRFVRHNLRIVLLIAQRYVPALPLQDLVQEGNLGLIDALRRFDPTRGVRFCTYAGWWVTHHIRRAIDDQRTTIRVPVHTRENRRKADRERARFETQYGRQPDDEELGAALDLTQRATGYLLSGNNGATVSLDARGAGDDGEGVALLDRLCSPVPDPLDALEQKERALDARRRMAKLPARERGILAQRYADDAPTLKEVGAGYRGGVCRERVRQIQADAIGMLQRDARAEAR